MNKLISFWILMLVVFLFENESNPCSYNAYNKFGYMNGYFKIELQTLPIKPWKSYNKSDSTSKYILLFINYINKDICNNFLK